MMTILADHDGRSQKNHVFFKVSKNEYLFYANSKFYTVRELKTTPLRDNSQVTHKKSKTIVISIGLS